MVLVRRKCISVVTVLVLMLGVVLVPFKRTAEASFDASEYINRVAVLVNEQRAANGVAPLKLSPELNDVASVRANELVSVFSHYRPDGSVCFTAFAQRGINYYACAENIAGGYGSPEAVMSGWMSSSGHRGNILSSNYEYIGIGVVNVGGTLYWVQDFASGTGMTGSVPGQAPAPDAAGASGFIERLYTVALGRSSDPSGAQYWLNRVTNGNATGADLARGFLYSPEFLNKNTTNEVFVDTLYRTFFNRDPDPNGRTYWLGRLSSGMSRQQVIEGFINSVEWYQLCSSYGIRSGSAAAPA